MLSLTSLASRGKPKVMFRGARRMAYRKVRRLYTHCRNSLMETDFLKHNLRLHRRPTTTVSADHGELVYRNDGFIEEVSTTSIEPLYAELEHFLQCVRGVETPAVDGLQASRTLQLADRSNNAWRARACA